MSTSFRYFTTNDLTHCWQYMCQDQNPPTKFQEIDQIRFLAHTSLFKDQTGSKKPQETVEFVLYPGDVVEISIDSDPLFFKTARIEKILRSQTDLRPYVLVRSLLDETRQQIYAVSKINVEFSRQKSWKQIIANSN